MLQDLDSLAARLAQLVQLTHQLQTERGSLHARIKSLEQERNALREQLDHLETQQQSITQRLEQHDTEVDAVRREADAANVQLRTDVARYQAEHDALKQQLLSSQSNVSRLHEAASSARDRVDAILMRLPGASTE